MVERTQRGAISPSTGRTLPDRYIEGTCPICGYGEARGDQCDNCGNQLEPEEPINPRSKVNGETPVFVETQHFFLDLPALADSLRTWLEGREASGTWRPNVIKFSLNILDDIKPRAMTRDIDWGIPVPLDGWRDQPTKRLYVWFDAVVGYLSASIEWARRLPEVDGQSQADRWREWWNDPEALSYYFMGKGQHHLPLPDLAGRAPGVCRSRRSRRQPRRVRGAQPADRGRPERVPSPSATSSSPPAAATSSRARRPDRYGPDGIRYFICAAGPESQDSAFTWRDFVQRNNSELVAGWGNLVSRSRHGRQELRRDPATRPLDEVDEAVLATVEQAFTTVGDLLARQRVKAATAEAMRAVGEVNAYVSRTEPFKLKGDDQRERLATVLHTLIQCVSDLNTILAPVLPHAANRVHAVLGGRVSSCRCRSSRTSAASTAMPTAPIRSSPASTPVPHAGAGRRSSSAPRSSSRRRFTKLDDSVVDENSPGWAAEPLRARHRMPREIEFPDPLQIPCLRQPHPSRHQPRGRADRRRRSPA